MKTKKSNLIELFFKQNIPRVSCELFVMLLESQSSSMFNFCDESLRTPWHHAFRLIMVTVGDSSKTTPPEDPDDALWTNCRGTRTTPVWTPFNFALLKETSFHLTFTTYFLNVIATLSWNCLIDGCWGNCPSQDFLTRGSPLRDFLRLSFTIFVRFKRTKLKCNLSSLQNG